MLYSKPANKSYTDMSQEFDREFYLPNRNDSKLYKYMYLIYYMLACKKNYFHKFEDYDEFSQFATSVIYTRFIKKQKKGERIKSILNYAKSTVYPLRVMYQNESFADIKNPNINQNYDTFEFKQKLKSSIQSDYIWGMQEEIEKVLETLPKLIKDTLDETPYNKNTLMYKRIYKSCLLTLINSITLNNANKKRYEERLKKNTLNNEFFFKIVSKERESDPILWKLDNSMKDYIKVITNKIRTKLNDEILDTQSSFMLPDDVLDSILVNSSLENNKTKEVWDDEK